MVFNNRTKHNHTWFQLIDCEIEHVNFKLWQNFLRFSYFKNLSKAQALPRGGGCLDLTDANALKFIVPFLWTKLTITMTITSFKRFCHKIQRPSVQAHCWETRVICLYTNYFPVN
jgi:hypothetical protein